MHYGDQRHAGLCLGQRTCRSLRLVQGRSQGITPSASDLYNARATILNPFYNMEYERIKKMKQKYGVNLSGHSRHKSHSQTVQCTCPSRCLHKQWRHNSIQLRDVIKAALRTLVWTYVNGTEIVLKSMDRSSNVSLFLYVQGLIYRYLIVFISSVIRWNFSAKCGVFHCRTYYKITIYCRTKTAGVITNDGFLECIIFAQCTVYNARWRNNRLQTML